MLELKEPTFSHRLSVLKGLHLVMLRADGNFRWYRLNDEVLGRISRTVFSRDSIAKLAVSAGARDPERKVLDSFVDGNRLLEIPVSYKKRLVILKCLAGFFEMATSFTEAQLNPILKQHH